MPQTHNPLYSGAICPKPEESDVQKSGKDLPNIGYTTVYPLATIGKIVLAQALVYLLR